MHLVVDHLELRESNDLEWRLDQATSVEVDGLGAVLAVADVGSLYPDHLDDRFKHGRLEVGTSWKTYADDGTARSNVLSRLLEWLLVHSHEDNSMRTKTIRCSLLHISNDVLA